MSRNTKHKKGGGKQQEEVERQESKSELTEEENWEENCKNPFKKNEFPRTPPSQGNVYTSVDAEYWKENTTEGDRNKRKREVTNTSPMAMEKKAKNPENSSKKASSSDREMQEVGTDEETVEQELQLSEGNHTEDNLIEISSDENDSSKKNILHEIDKDWEEEEEDRTKSDIGNEMETEDKEEENKQISKIQELKNVYAELQKAIKNTTNVKKEIHQLIDKMGTQLEEVKNEISGKKTMKQEGKEKEMQETATQTSKLQENKSTQTKGNKLMEIKPTNTIENYKEIASYYWNEECYQRTALSELNIEQFPPEYAIAREEIRKQKGTGKLEEDYLIQYNKQEGKIGTVIHILNTSEVETGEDKTEKLERHYYILRTKNKDTEIIKEEDIYNCLKELKTQLIKHKIEKIVIDKIGGGNTKIAWGAIRKMIEYIFFDTEIEFIIHGMKKPKRMKEEEREAKEDVIERETTERSEKQNSNKENNNTTWSKILGGKAIEKSKTQIGTRKGKDKIKQKTAQAIIISTKNEQYATILKNIKTKVKPEELGVKIKAIRKTKKGEVLIETGGVEENIKLKKTIEEINIGEKIRILNEDYKTETIVISNIEEGTDKTEIEHAIRNNIDQNFHDTIDIKALKTTYNQTVTAIIKIAAKGAQQLIEQEQGNIKIGWITCKIRRWVQVLQCQKCYKYDHSTKECKEKDKKAECINCGQMGHTKNDCKEEETCIVCNIKGHKTGTAKCPRHRRALEEARKAARSRFYN